MLQDNRNKMETNQRTAVVINTLKDGETVIQVK